jgi:hypothetical protein
MVAMKRAALNVVNGFSRAFGLRVRTWQVASFLHNQDRVVLSKG